MRKTVNLFLMLFLTSVLYSQVSYKEMMYDNSYNFYEVCAAAELHFESIDKNVKGSGWKGYQRWKNANESMFYPSGERSQIDPFFTQHAYEVFLSNNPSNKALYNNGWEEIGPRTIDSITGHYSPGIGRVEDLYVDPNNANRMYIGSRSGGFWRSLDGGNTWSDGLTDFLFASGVNSFGVSPFDPNEVLINVRNSRNGNSHGLYQSFDGGDNWAITNFNPVNIGFGGLGSYFQVYEVAYHPTISGLLFVGTSRGLYRSADSGTSWTALMTGEDVSHIDFHPSNPNIIYFVDNFNGNGTRNYVWRSTDAGLTFSLSNAVPGNSNQASRISVSSSCPQCLYFASSNGVWKSEDEGMNFTLLGTPAQTCGGFSVSDIDTSMMVFGYVDMEFSQDGGRNFNKNTWWSLGSAEHGAGVFDTKFFTSDKYVHADLRVAKCVNGVFYVGTDGLFAKSEDNGLTWENLSQGLGLRENYKLGASQSNHFRSISGSQDNGTSIRVKDTWVEFYGADGMEGLIHPLNDDYMIGSVQYGSRRRTLNGGLTQSGANAPGQSGSGSGAWEAPITYSPNDQMTLYNFSDSIYRSDDFGSNWTYLSIPVSFLGSINQSAIAENNSDIIVISKSDDIEKSIDGGLTWSSIKNNLPNYYIEDIAFHPLNDDIILVCYARYQNDNSKIFMTLDGGLTWTNITFNLGNMPLRSVVVDHQGAGNIYVGAEIGVYTKPLNGNTWTLYNTELPNCTVEELEIVYGSNTIRAATWGRGLWEYSLVGRLNFPAIMTTTITDPPTMDSPKEGKDQFITSTISYDGVLSSVYVEWGINNPSAINGTINMSNIQDSTWRSDLALPNFPIGTKIYFKVKAIGSINDTTETYKFMYTLYPFEYCASSGTMQYDGNVTLVDFGDINRVSGKTQPYTDYSFTDSTEVYAGNSYNMTVNLNTDNGNYTYYAGVWIDWNQDADFNDTGESYQLGSVTNNSNAATDLSPFTVAVPANAVSGTTKMRVACRYNGYPSLCETGFDGEVEDYAIVVKNTPSLAYSLNAMDFCLGSSVMLSYQGEMMDSISWEVSNGLEIFNSTNLTFGFSPSTPGNFNVSLSGFLNGIEFNLDSINAFVVHESIDTMIIEFSCDSSDIGVFVDSFLTQYACDSIVSTTVSFLSEIDTTVVVLNNSLMAQQNSATYQWLDCNDLFSIIPGANNQQFAYSENGIYAVQIDIQNCIDTSSCFEITNVGISNLIEGVQVSVYPNPVDNILMISFSKAEVEFSIEVLDVLGKRVLSKSSENELSTTLDFSYFSSGTYFLQISSLKDMKVFEIIKK